MTGVAVCLILAWIASTWSAGVLVAPAVRLALASNDVLSALSIVAGLIVNGAFVIYLVGVEAGLIASTAVSTSPPVRFAGLLLALSGIVLARRARKCLGSSWKPLVTFSGSQLCESGPYRFIRHPVYAGAILLYLGTAFVASQLVGFVAMGVQAAGYLCKTSLEDRTLLDDLAGYGGFAARTRWRLLPGVY